SYLTGLNNPLTGERVQMSLLDLSHADDLRKEIDVLTKRIRGAFKSTKEFDSSRRAACRDAFIAAAAGDVRPLVDLTDLSRALERDLCDPELRPFILKTLLKSRAITKKRKDWLERNAQNLEDQLVLVNKKLKLLIRKSAAHPSLDLGGIGIFVPFVTD